MSPTQAFQRWASAVETAHRASAEKEIAEKELDLLLRQQPADSKPPASADADDGFITHAEAAEELGVTRATVRTWIRKGEIKAAKEGRNWLIRNSEWKRFKRDTGRG